MTAIASETAVRTYQHRKGTTSQKKGFQRIAATQEANL